MPRKTPAQRAEAAIASVLKQLEKARAEVARLEEVVAKLGGNLSAAQPAAAAPRSAPVAYPPEVAAMMQQAEEMPQEPPIELSSADSMGSGRWM